MQTRTPASQSQNRENQRRSRARRREYVEDLQRRLQEYERRGVEATLQMQQAAKAVALENEMLRGLLHARGVSQHDIDGYCRSFSRTGCETETVPGSYSSRRVPVMTATRRQSCGDGFTEMMSRPRRTTAKSLQPSTHPSSSAPAAAEPLEATHSRAATSIPPTSEPEDSAMAIIESHDDRGHNLNHDHNSDDDSLRASQVPRRDPTELWNNCPETSTLSGSDILPPMPDCYCPPDPTISTPGPTMTAMPCEVAIRIIVDLQCYMDSARARELLDCVGGNDCLVQNSKLFRILDMIA